MPYAMVPPGYRAVLIGQAAAIEELGTFAPLEENSAEGALFLVRLDFTEFPPAEALDQLEQAFFDAGVEMWPGYSHVVYADVEQPRFTLPGRRGWPGFRLSSACWSRLSYRRFSVALSGS